MTGNEKVAEKVRAACKGWQNYYVDGFSKRALDVPDINDIKIKTMSKNEELIKTQKVILYEKIFRFFERV